MKANTWDSICMVSSCLTNSDKMNSPKQLEKQRNSSVLTIQLAYFLYVGFSSLTIAFRNHLDCSYIQVRLDRKFRISQFPLIWPNWRRRYVINNSNDNETIPKCKCNVPKSCKITVFSESQNLGLVCLRSVERSVGLWIKVLSQDRRERTTKHMSIIQFF